MDEQSSVAIRIRLFLRELLGSRLLDHLTEEMMRLRADYETRLQERERVIADLREQSAQLQSKIDRYEMVLIPLVNPAARSHRDLLLQATGDPRPLTWPEIQRQNEEEQERLAKEEAASRAQS